MDELRCMSILNRFGGILDYLAGDLYLERRYKATEQGEEEEPGDVPGVGSPDQNENTRPCRGYYAYLLAKALDMFHFLFFSV